jgi:hypothetical protein
MLPLELKKYPGVFARVLGATSAGQEAVAALLTDWPGLSLDAMTELVRPTDVTDASLDVVVELFKMAFDLCRAAHGRDQFAPFGAAYHFLRANGDRLSPEHRMAFLSLVLDHEDGPYPGGPLDILAALRTDPTLKKHVVARVSHWLDTGRFDGFDAATRSDRPALFYGFVANTLKDGLLEEAHDLLRGAQKRMRKLFRSDRPHDLVAALRWLADADRLPPLERGPVARAYEEGVISAEFEAGEYADVVGQLATLLARAVAANEHTSTQLRAQVAARLREAGLPDTFA